MGHATIIPTGIADLLKLCRTTSHALTTGRHLAPLLIGRPWQTPDDDGLLLAALQTILATALRDRRQVLGCDPEARTGMAQFQADCATGDLVLLRLSSVWAYYVDQLDSGTLAAVAGVSIRTMQVRIQEGRTQVAAVLQTPPSAAPEAAARPPQQASADTAAAVPAGGAPPRPSPASITGTQVQSVQGTVHGSVYQQQHIHQATPRTPPSPTSESPAVTAMRVLLGLSVVVGVVVLLRAPLAGLVLLLLISGARTIHLVVQGVRLATSASPSNQAHWWDWRMALPWAVHTLLATLITSRAVVLLAEPSYTVGRLLVVVFGVMLLLQLLWLLLTDLLLWVAQTTTVPQVLRWTAPLAAYAWEQRGWVQALRWGMVSLSSLLALLNGYLWWG
ncbi:MAG: hypothetical protein HC828_03855 [Blastochloris sp.]|nr:hypothetical protein [Blastochloris sp.]